MEKGLTESQGGTQDLGPGTLLDSRIAGHAAIPDRLLRNSLLAQYAHPSGPCVVITSVLDSSAEEERDIKQEGQLSDEYADSFEEDPSFIKQQQTT